jgi:hypothetical protein
MSGRTARAARAAQPRRTPPVVVRPDEVALYVTVALDGRADYGGRMSPTDAVEALRFLARSIEVEVAARAEGAAS